jgi:nucleoside-diphosphate-sugar epimerase
VFNEDYMKNDVIAVTGGCGYIGAQLVRALREGGFKDVRVFDRSAADSGQVCPFDLSKAGIDVLAQELAGVDVIFHLAAARTDWGLTFNEYYSDNVLATRNLVAAAKKAGIKRWIYYGTVGVYGPSSSPLDETSPFAPTSDYATTKAKAEEELIQAAEEEKWALRIVRPSAVYSEGQPSNTNLYRLIEAIRRNRFALIGSGSEVKTTSYLHNLVDATLWLYEGLANGGVDAYNYVDEPKMTTKEMVEFIRRELDCKLPLVKVPLGLIEKPARMLDVLGNYIGQDFPVTAARIRKFCTATNFDSSKIRNAGFVPKYSSQEAIKRTVHWHKYGL